MMSVSLLADLFAACGVVVLERQQDGSFQTRSAVPPWFIQLYPPAARQQEGLQLCQAFPFLDNFLIDAEQFWFEQRPGQLKSGVWHEFDQARNAYYPEALAVCIGSHKILLLVFQRTDYEEKRSLLQQARENILITDRLHREIQKKEILLHCIVHDLVSPLTSIISSLSLLDFEKLSTQGKEYVDLGLREAMRQERMIQQILDVFATEMGTATARISDPAQAPDVAACAREVVLALLPVCTQKNLQLQLVPGIDTSKNWQVVSEKSRLERVLFNLLENAIRHSPSGTSITIGLQRDAGGILVTVDDEGPGVPPESVATLFHKFSQGQGLSGKMGLGLYFCRMMIDLWGGSINYAPRPGGGSRFWFRLPCPAA